MVVLWIMTSSESPDLALHIEHSAVEIESSAAILEICACCCVLNPTNLMVATPSVIRPSKHFHFDSLEKTLQCHGGLLLQPLSVGVLMEEMLSKAMVSDRLCFLKGLLTAV